MFKKISPKRVSYVTTPEFPHCEPRILHAPGECQFCDEHAHWQELRQYWGIAFTGYEPENKELPCPADYARGDGHKLWGGNVASPKERDTTGIDNAKPGSGY